MRKKILEEFIKGCAPKAAGLVLAALFCILLSFCSCKPTEKLVEVEKWQHDTTTVVDTLRIKEYITLHDSIFIKENLSEEIHDSTQTNVAWQHYTYDKEGNVTSMTNYNSTTQHGSAAHNSTASEKTSVSDQTFTHEETSSHNESQGHSDALQSKAQEKRGLTKWQKFVMGMGYAFIVILGIGLSFGALRLYGKINKL